MNHSLSDRTNAVNGHDGQPATPVPARARKALAGTSHLRGVLLLMGGLFFFACMDTTTKYLTLHFPVPFIVAMRYIVNCVLMFAMLAPIQGKQLVRTHRTGMVVFRAACLVVGSLFVSLALQRMPVAETTAIVFLGPMLVVLIARPVLGERIGFLGWAAAVTGLAGVLLIARPGSGLDTFGIVFGLVTVVTNALYQLLSRVLASTERTVALLFYTTLVGSICFGIVLPWYWTRETPSLLQVLLLLSMGVNGGIGHYLYTAAFRHAPASLLAPVNYLQLLWAGMLGWMVFGHVPDGLTIVGMGIVALSGGLIALKSRRT